MIPMRLTTIPTSTIPRRPVLLDVIPTLAAASTKPANVTTRPTNAIFPPPEDRSHADVVLRCARRTPSTLTACPYAVLWNFQGFFRTPLGDPDADEGRT